MRKITIQASDHASYSDLWQKWIDDCEVETKALIEAVKKGEKPKIGNLYKRKDIKEKYFISKNAPFYGRCAYCEAPIADFLYVDIEHFRPKAEVKDADGKIIYCKDDQGNEILDNTGKPTPHLGYYWLAYDWKNLIPSCEICNRPNKSTRFPVIGNHAQSPGDEAKEQPLLINPISDRPDDDPEKHLAVDPETGTMFALNNSDRGAMCIKIFNLNERDQLIEGRKSAKFKVQVLLSDIRETLGMLNDPVKSKKNTCKILIEKYDQLIEIWEGKESYSMMSRNLLINMLYSLEWLQETRQAFLDLLSKL